MKSRVRVFGFEEVEVEVEVFVGCFLRVVKSTEEREFSIVVVV